LNTLTSALIDHTMWTMLVFAPGVSLQDLDLSTS